MAVEFNEIPNSSLRVPFFYAELNSAGSVFNSNSRLLLIGQKFAAGVATADEPVLISEGNAEELFGVGSMMAEMFDIARKNAPFQEIWGLPLDDAGAGVAATGTVDLTTLNLPLALSSTYNIYIGGRRYSVSVSTADTAITIGAALTTEINDDDCRFVDAVDNLNGTVTLTARHAGALGNEIDIRTGYYGFEPAFANATTIVPMAGGATDPDMTAAIANLGEDEYDFIAFPYSDTQNLDAVKDLLDNSVGRWGPMQMQYGIAITTKVDTVGNLSAAGNLRNDPHVSMIGLNGYPTPSWLVAAAAGAKAAKHLTDAPELSRPLQYITLSGVLAPKSSDRFSKVDRNTLLYDGVATLTAAQDGSVQLERLITTYQTNAAGVEDATWLDIQTLAQSQFIIRYIRSKVVAAHGRKGLADDDNPPIQTISRPRDIAVTIISGYNELIQLGVVEDLDTFANALVVERNATDANRVDVFLPYDVVNQLRIVATNFTTNLQFPSEG